MVTVFSWIESVVLLPLWRRSANFKAMVPQRFKTSESSLAPLSYCCHIDLPGVVPPTETIKRIPKLHMMIWQTVQCITFCLRDKCTSRE